MMIFNDSEREAELEQRVGGVGGVGGVGEWKAFRVDNHFQETRINNKNPAETSLSSGQCDGRQARLT